MRRPCWRLSTFSVTPLEKPYRDARNRFSPSWRTWRRCPPRRVVPPGSGGRVSRLLAAILVGGALTAGAAANAADAREVTGLAELRAARLVFSDETRPPADAGMAVVLPDRWQVSNPQGKGYAWYLIDWPLSTLTTELQSIYLSALTTQAQLYVNGTKIGETGDLRGRYPRSWDKAHAFVVPQDVLQPAGNQLAVRIYASDPDYAGMGTLIVGPATQVRDRVFRDTFMHTLGPATMSVAVIVLGLFIVSLWLRRRDPAYGLFGLAAILWGVHTIVTLLPFTVLPQPHYAVWWNTVYMTFVALLCLVCIRFAELGWRAYRRIVVGYAVALLPVLYGAEFLGVLDLVGDVVRLAGIVLAAIALVAVARHALRIRNAESLLLLLAGTVSIALGAHDWMIAHDPLQLRPLWLAPYAALSFMLLFGWILTDRFSRALNTSEELNLQLEERVAQQSVALRTQLEETRTARDAAVAANHSKSRFLAAASHDLRQPLHALGLFSTALIERTTDPESVALVTRINTSVSSLDALFSALLDVSKLDAGVITAMPVDMALDPMLDRLANDFAPEALEKDLRLAVLPSPMVVHSDPVLLERIARNLLSNAIQHSIRGGVVLGCRRRRGRVAIEIWDTGLGFPPGERERIFEEFYQLGNSERDRSRGLGLGLAIVRRLADLLGHDVEVDSRPGRGSVFRVLLPFGDPANVGADTPDSVQLPSDLVGRRIAVVDDEIEICEGMRTLLAQWGCIPVVAKSAIEAIARLEGSANPDAVIVDYRLRDGEDGIDVVGKLRARFGAELPAVAISGESSPAGLARIKAAGLILLHKPVPPAKLRSALTYMLTRRAPDIT